MASTETDASECSEAIRRLSFVRAKLKKELAGVETLIRAETAKLDILMAPALEALERDIGIDADENTSEGLDAVPGPVSGEMKEAAE